MNSAAIVLNNALINPDIENVFEYTIHYPLILYGIDYIVLYYIILSNQCAIASNPPLKPRYTP